MTPQQNLTCPWDMAMCHNPSHQSSFVDGNLSKSHSELASDIYGHSPSPMLCCGEAVGVVLGWEIAFVACRKCELSQLVVEN